MAVSRCLDLARSLLVGFCFALLVNTAHAQPSVLTPVGQITGVSKANTTVNAFLGIPYAKPPVGALRFRKPLPMAPFEGTYNATEYGQACSQGGQGGEDCLFLNVFVPENISSENPVPVMVWIHGGAFQFDTSSNYDASGLARHGRVIVVSMNYRLGVLGFLNTEDISSPGNYGLWDQLLALQWVKQNIGAFGGDTEKVTLIGESAGAASVAYHALSPHSKGLFQRVILESGTAISPFALTRTPRQYANEFAQRVGCINQDQQIDMKSVVECLRAKTVEDIIQQSQGMTKPLGLSVIDFSWVPSVDGDFIPDDPNSLIANNTYLHEIGFFDTDLLLGMNNDEGSLVFLLANLNQVGQKGVVVSATEGVSKTFYEDEFIPAIVRQTFGNDTREAKMALKYMYESDNDIESNDMVPSADWFRTYSDATFLAGITRHALVHSSGQGGGTYLYLFDHKLSYSTDPQVTGTPHGGEVPFVFGFAREGDAKLNYTQEEYALSLDVMTYWTNMAKSGSPNRPGVEVPVQWPEFSSDKQGFLKLSTSMSNASVGMGLFVRRAEFWLDFMPAILPRDDNQISEDGRGSKDDDKVTVPSTSKPPSDQPKPAQFIERFNIDSATAEGTIIGLAVVVAILSAIVLVVVVFSLVFCRRKKNSNYDID